MKIEFSKKHKDKIISYIKEYQNISNENYKIYNKVKSLQKEIDELTANLQSSEDKLQSIRDDEKKYMDELHLIYGDFTLNDLYESIY